MKKILIFSALIFSIVSAYSQQAFYDVIPADGNGLRLWNNDYYKISMGNSSDYHFGPVTGYSIKTNMTSQTDRGWVWGVMNQTPVAAISTIGDFQINRNFISLGKIGIGTTTLNSKLTIQGDGSTVGSASINLKHSGNGMSIGLGASSNNLHIGNSWNPESGTYMTIQDSTGYIGVGTNNPVDKLTLNDGDMTIGNSTNHEYNIWFRPGDNKARSSVIGYSSNVTSNDYIGMQTKWGSIRFITNDGNEVVRVTDSERVGIGTSDPQSKLAVNGQIRATEVKVLALIDVPDYVFEADYNLRSLKETKDYIATNKHLPEIPSASEIGENGIDLGDMNMKLLKKIEELTLHLIRQNEKLDAQQIRIEKLEKQK